MVWIERIERIVREQMLFEEVRTRNMINIGGRIIAVQIMTMRLEMLLVRKKRVRRIATVIEWMVGMVRKITLMHPHI